MIVFELFVCILSYLQCVLIILIIALKGAVWWVFVQECVFHMNSFLKHFINLQDIACIEIVDKGGKFICKDKAIFVHPCLGKNVEKY